MGRGSGKTILIDEVVSGGGYVDREIPESWLAEGSAMRRALVADFAAVPGVRVVELVDARCQEDQPPLANVTRIVADRDHPIDRVALMDRVDAAVIVAPGESGELARLCEQFGLRSLGSTERAITLCSDKLALAQFFERTGVPTPPTRIFQRQNGLPEVATDSGRVVIKPTDGDGAVDTWVLDASTRTLPSSWRRSAGLIQPYRAGSALSASFLIARDGHAHLIAVGRQAIVVGPEGKIRYEGGEVPIPSDAAELALIQRTIESIPGLFGFVGVDFIRAEPTGALEVIEINPRVTTSLVGLVQLAPPGTIASAWLDCLGDAPARSELSDTRITEPAPGRGFEPGADFLAIRSAPPVRFRADGTISNPPTMRHRDD